ncbi:hypothetical protein GBA52_001831 [Prunus armeniaca]|nr:hypothetical protein GBA52_001831 [Prunus armeniaca]
MIRKQPHAQNESHKHKSLSLSLSLSLTNIKSSRLSLFGCSGGERSPFQHCGVAQETSGLSLATCHRQLEVAFICRQTIDFEMKEAFGKPIIPRKTDNRLQSGP